MKNHLYTNEGLLGQDFPTILFEKTTASTWSGEHVWSKSSGKCPIQLKFPNPRNISPPIDGSKGTKFKCCLTVQTPIAMQVNFCLTLVRFSYLSYVESVQTSDRCSFSQREASHETFITQRHLGLRDALSRGWISHYGWGSHRFCRVAEIS